MPACAMEIRWVLTRNNISFLEKSYTESVLPILWLKLTEIRKTQAFLLYGDNITNLDLLQSPDCVKMEIYEAERGKVQWCIHCSSVSATVRAYPLGSCWKSGGCLIGWWRGHMGAPPERHQGPSTCQWGQPLLKSRLGDHPHLQVWISSLLDSRSDPSLQIVSINLASQLRLALAMRDMILHTENTILIRINW